MGPHPALAADVTPLPAAAPGITFMTVLLVAARCVMRLHFSYRGMLADLQEVTVQLASNAIILVDGHGPAVKCEACGAEEMLPQEEYPRAQRVKVRETRASEGLASPGQADDVASEPT